MGLKMGWLSSHSISHPQQKKKIQNPIFLSIALASKSSYMYTHTRLQL